METIPSSYFSQSGSLHTTVHSLDSIDECDNPSNKRKSSAKKEKPMPHESSKRKGKQTDFNKPKTNKGPKQSKAPASPISTLIAAPGGHYLADGDDRQRREFKENPNERPNPSIDYSSDLYRTMSKATLIDQESGEVYQLIENKRGSARETFLLQEPPTSSPNIYDVPGRNIRRERSGGWTAALSTNLNGPPGRTRDDKSEFSNDLQLLIPDQDSGSNTSVERFIAVPVSPNYLTDHIRNIQASTMRKSEYNDSTSLVSALVHAPSELPPPTSERLSPIGANSRATSKLSLDVLDEETKC